MGKERNARSHDGYAGTGLTGPIGNSLYGCACVDGNFRGGVHVRLGVSVGGGTGREGRMGKREFEKGRVLEGEFGRRRVQ